MLLTACQKNDVKQELVIIEEEIEQPDVIEENIINETETVAQEEVIVNEENIVEQEIEVPTEEEKAHWRFFVLLLFHAGLVRRNTEPDADSEGFHGQGEDS